MTHYRFLLFDVDDTLLNFTSAERLALRLMFEEQRIPLTEEIIGHYRVLNQNLWKAYEDGLMSQEEVVNTRFSTLLGSYGHEVDGAFMEQQYRRYLDESHELVDGALELITRLADHYDLQIVTNGLTLTQDRRLRDSGLHSLFRQIFVSEAVGYQKPLKAFFDHVFAHISGFVREEALIIGDSLGSDIKGGQLAGIDTCWFNPQGKPNHSGITPTYEIQRLDELYGIVGLENLLGRV